MAARVKVVRHPAEWQKLMSSPDSGVYKDLYRRCVRVQNKAKRNLERAPRRIDTGRLRSDIRIQIVIIDGRPIGRVGFSVFYGLYVHEGTGIYGVKGMPIKPRRAKLLRWRPKKSGYVYAKAVKGMQPNPFLTDAIIAAKG